MFQKAKYFVTHDKIRREYQSGISWASASTILDTLVFFS